MADRRDALLVVSYNMLGHHEWFWDSSWTFNPETLPWAERLEAFDQELSALNADVICCQEVTTDMFAALLPRLAGKGYLGLHALKHLPEWTYNQGWETTQLGLAIFVRHTHLEVLETSHRFVRDLLKKEEAELDQPDGISLPLLSRQDSVLMCKLRWRRQGKTPQDFIIACAHAVWWYNDQKENPIACKPVQMMLMLRAVKDFADNCGGDVDRSVLCGDFNTMPRKGCSQSPYDDNAGYELFTTGILNRDHPEHPSQHGWNLSNLEAPFRLQSAYQLALHNEPVFTTKTSNFIATIDYIFIGGKLDVASVTPLPEECEPCPNKEHPSDHLPIGARVRWKSV